MFVAPGSKRQGESRHRVGIGLSRHLEQVRHDNSILLHNLPYEIRIGLFTKSLETLKKSEIYQTIKDSLELPDILSGDQPRLSFFFREKEMTKFEVDQLSGEIVG